MPMSSALRDAFERELTEARRLEARGELARASQRLERAHGSWTGRAPRATPGSRIPLSTRAKR